MSHIETRPLEELEAVIARYQGEIARLDLDALDRLLHRYDVCQVIGPGVGGVEMTAVEWREVRAWLHGLRDALRADQRPAGEPGYPRPDPSHNLWCVDPESCCPGCSGQRWENIGTHFTNRWQCLDCGWAGSTDEERPRARS